MAAYVSFSVLPSPGDTSVHLNPPKPETGDRITCFEFGNNTRLQFSSTAAALGWLEECRQLVLDNLRTEPAHTETGDLVCSPTLEQGAA